MTTTPRLPYDFHEAIQQDRSIACQIYDSLHDAKEADNQNKQQLSRLDRLEDLAERLENLAETNNKQIQANADAIAQLTSEYKNAANDMGNDIKTIKGWYAENRLRQQPHVIPITLGLNFVHRLDNQELTEMLQAHSTGISLDNQTSFKIADLITENTNPQGETVYVAIEVSFSADQEDVRRAVRNANFLTRFTGCQAIPVIASARNHPSLQRDLDSGRVHWHSIPQPRITIS